MPIDVEQLEIANRPLAERVLEFLRQDKRKAFGVVEVYAAVEGYDESVVAMVLLSSTGADRQRLLLPYEDALAQLEKDGLVRAGNVKGSRWFHAV